MQKYFDKHGEEIKAGMKLRHDNGNIELIYASDEDLGMNAANPKYLGGLYELGDLIYPLSQFNLREWEIVKETV